MARTYLQLCQDTARECRLGSVGTTVANATGDWADIVRWVKQAYIELQQLNAGALKFLRKDFTLTTTQGDRQYSFTDCQDVEAAAAIARFQEWRLEDRYNPPRAYLQASGQEAEYWCTYLDYEVWKNIYNISSNITTEGQPVHLTVDPDHRILCGPVPNDIYVISGEFWRSPKILADDDDTHELQEEQEYIIIYKAMQKYGGAEMAPEIKDRLLDEYNPLLQAYKRREYDYALRLGKAMA